MNTTATVGTRTQKYRSQNNFRCKTAKIKGWQNLLNFIITDNTAKYKMWLFIIWWIFHW